jgi:phage-related minor tail protein
MERKVGIRIEGDASGYTAATNQAEAATRKLDDATKMAEVGMRRAATSAGQYQQAMRQLPMQITDVTTSLVSGMPVWMVAVQQGGQIRDSFGGMGNAIQGVTSILTPHRLALGATAVTLGSVLLATEKGRAEYEAYQRAIILTGNAAGVTAGQLDRMARSSAAASGGTQGQAADVSAQLVAGGTTSRANIEQATVAAIALQRSLGVEIDKTVASFNALGKDPLQAAIKLNEQYSFLTMKTYEQIKALMEQRRVGEAAAVAQEAFAEVAIRRSAEMEKNLGTLQRSWRGVGDAAKSAWDFMLNLGRPDTLEQQLAAVEAALAAPMRRGGSTLDAEARRAAMIERRDTLQESIRLGARAADRQAEAAANVDDRIRRDRESKGPRRPEPPISNQLILDANDARVAAYDFDKLYPPANVNEVLRNSSVDSQRRRAELGSYDEIDRQMREAQAKRDADARKEAQEWMEYRLRLEEELLQKSQPVWEQMVASWGDMNQRMKDSFDNMVIGVIERGEEAWVRFAQTGKFNVASLVDFIIAQAARQGYREFIAAGVRFLSDYAASGNNPDYSNEGRNYPAPKVGESAGVGMKGAMAAGGGVPSLTIINQTGTPVQGTAKLTSGGGLEVLLTAVKSSIADDINNGEGPVVAAMGSRFGLRSSFSSA